MKVIIEHCSISGDPVKIYRDSRNFAKVKHLYIDNAISVEIDKEIRIGSLCFYEGLYLPVYPHKTKIRSRFDKMLDATYKWLARNKH